MKGERATGREKWSRFFPTTDRPIQAWNEKRPGGFFVLALLATPPSLLLYQSMRLGSGIIEFYGFNPKRRKMTLGPYLTTRTYVANLQTMVDDAEKE